MLDFFRGALSAAAVLDYLEHLPRTSAYHAAVGADEEVAEALARQREQAPKTPSTTEFSPEMQALATISDQLQVIANILVAANGGKAGAVKPYPRPVTALQKARERRRYDQHQSLVARVLPAD